MVCCIEKYNRFVYFIKRWDENTIQYILVSGELWRTEWKGTVVVVWTEESTGETGHETDGVAGQLHVVPNELLTGSTGNTGGDLVYSLNKLRPDSSNN